MDQPAEPADPPVAVRRVRPDEGPLLRAIRLAALADAPAAFVQTHDVVAALPAREWQARAREGAVRADRATYVAETSTGWVGMAGGYTDHGGVAHCVSVWVHPDYRGRAVADLLIGAVQEWAVSGGHHRVVLWVHERNAAARRCYERLGYGYTGRSMPYRLDPDASEVEMELTLRPPPPG